MQTHPRQQTTITIERRGQAISVPVCRELYVLRTVRHTAHPRHPRQIVPLYHVDRQALAGTQLLFLAGLLPVVVYLLRRAGYRVISERLVPRLSRPDVGKVQRLGPTDIGLLKLIRNQERGIIRYTQGNVSRAWLIAQVALAWPGLRITVVGIHRDETLPIARELQDYLPPSDVLWLPTADTPEDRRHRVAVCVYAGLVAADAEHRDVIFVLDAVEVLGAQPFRDLQLTARTRLFGFVPADAHIAPYDADGIAELFGFEQVTIREYGWQPRPVTVAICPITGGPRLTDFTNYTDLRRRGVWQHPVRNRILARVARLLAAGRYDELCRRFPRFTAALEVANLTVQSPIILVVDNIEQAIALAPQLPDWSLRTDGFIYSEGLTEAQLTRLRAARHTVPRSPHVIMTRSLLALSTTRNAHVAIYAAGGNAALHTKEFVSDNMNNPLVVVDCDDRTHRVLRQASRKRVADYVMTGCNVIGRAALTPVEEFLLARPKPGRTS